MHRIPGRILLIVAAFALFLVPIAAIAAGGFDDVGDDNVFKADIEWLANAGVTKGCNPPTNTKFCPEDNVTREQMSAFMHRLAINKVVDAKTAVDADNADTLDGMDSTEFLGKTEKAADSEKLDGKDSTEFLGKTEKAADADLFDGRNSNTFIFNAEWHRNTTGVTGVAPGAIVEGVAGCPINKYPVAGGGESDYSALVMADSMPYTGLFSDGWKVRWKNVGTTTLFSPSLHVDVLCAGTGFAVLPLSEEDQVTEKNG